MKEIRRLIGEARAKLRHLASRLAIDERRIKHFRKRYEHYRRNGNERGATRARRRLGLWRARRNRRLRLQSAWQQVFRHRIRRKKKWLKSHKPPRGPNGLEIFDGKEVAEGFSYWLKKSRDAGWKGYVVSGYRTPSYSQSLCYSMCGAPSCPGRCAGSASNHSKSTLKEGGAVDLTDYYSFERIQFEIDSPLRNYLGSADPVHFSISGR